MTTLIDGKGIAARLRAAIATRVIRLQQAHDLTPGLGVVLVGEDPASQIYVRNKARQAREAGMASFEHRLAADTDLDQVLEAVHRLNEDANVHGILVQLPLPPQIDPATVTDAIAKEKDVDGFKPINVGLLNTGGTGIVPCTPLGCLILLKQYRPELAGLHALIIGRSNIVGKPMAALLLKENCTVTIAHSHTRDLASECRRADIVVAAMGRPGMIRGDWIKPGATVIDVGINRITSDQGKTRLVGDVDYPSACQVAGAITPVPGGVGPMTIACLLLNTLRAACQQRAIPLPSLTELASDLL